MGLFWEVRGGGGGKRGAAGMDGCMGAGWDRMGDGIFTYAGAGGFELGLVGG